MARGRRSGRLRVGHRVRHPHAALSRAAARRHHAADRAHGAGQRHRGVARDAGRALRAQRPALHARRRPSRRPSADRRLPHRALADLDLPRRGRHRGQPGGGRLPRARPRHRALAPARILRPGAADGAPAALGPRLPCPAPREPGLRLRRRGHRRARAVAAVSGRAGDLGGDRRQLPARAGLVPQLPVRRRARARPRLHRGSRLARRVRLDAERQRCDADAARRARLDPI